MTTGRSIRWFPFEPDSARTNSSFAQSTPTATLENRLTRRFRLQLNENIDVGELTKVLPSNQEIDGTIDGLDVVLGGVKLKAKKAIVEHQSDVILIRFIDPK